MGPRIVQSRHVSRCRHRDAPTTPEARHHEEFNVELGNQLLWCTVQADVSGKSSGETPIQPLPSTGEQLAAIQSAFGLNKSQLAGVCAVKRQTIYDWYAGIAEAEGANAVRLAQLYRVVTTLRSAGLRHVPLRAVDKVLAGGETLLRLLCAEELNPGAIEGAVAQLQAASGAPKESARSQRLELATTHDTAP